MEVRSHKPSFRRLQRAGAASWGAGPAGGLCARLILPLLLSGLCVFLSLWPSTRLWGPPGCGVHPAVVLLA